jgi:putative heme iron utilization protein
MPRTTPDTFEPVRQLWAGRFQGIISTHSVAEPGYPFGSLVPYCLDRNGLPIFLFSHLAQHAHNLAGDRRCAFTLTEVVPGDIQQAQRLTCIGECEPCAPPRDDAVDRYLRYYAPARIYYEQLNFRPYRLQPKRFHYNGGFAAARWLSRERVVRPSPLNAAAEADLSGALARSQAPLFASLLPEPSDAPVQIAGVDPWGLDLVRGDRLRRLAFPQPMSDAADIAAYLENLPDPSEPVMPAG